MEKKLEMPKISPSITGSRLDRAFVQSEAERVFNCIEAGGAAIFALDIAYAIGGNSRAAIEKTLRAKRRAAGKRNGGLGSIEMSKEIQVLDGRFRDMIRAVTVDHDLPFTIVAPVRMEHPYLKAFDPWVRDLSTKNGTMSLLLNGGPLLNALAPMCLAASMPIVGSSANISLEGSNFSLESIEPEIRAAADVETNFGLSRYYEPNGISSTIISLPDFQVIRFGAFYEKIRDILKRDFGQDLPVRPTTYVHREQLENALA